MKPPGVRATQWIPARVCGTSSHERIYSIFDSIHEFAPWLQYLIKLCEGTVCLKFWLAQSCARELDFSLNREEMEWWGVKLSSQEGDGNWSDIRLQGGASVMALFSDDRTLNAYKCPCLTKYIPSNYPTIYLKYLLHYTCTSLYLCLLPLQALLCPVAQFIKLQFTLSQRNVGKFNTRLLGN